MDRILPPIYYVYQITFIGSFKNITVDLDI